MHGESWLPHSKLRDVEQGFGGAWIGRETEKGEETVQSMCWECQRLTGGARVIPHSHCAWLRGHTFVSFSWQTRPAVLDVPSSRVRPPL